MRERLSIAGNPRAAVLCRRVSREEQSLGRKAQRGCPAWPEKEEGKMSKRLAEKVAPLQVRLDAMMIARLDRVAELLSRPGIALTRMDAIRAAIEEGLRVIESDAVTKLRLRLHGLTAYDFTWLLERVDARGWDGKGESAADVLLATEPYMELRAALTALTRAEAREVLGQVIESQKAKRAE